MRRRYNPLNVYILRNIYVCTSINHKVCAPNRHTQKFLYFSKKSAEMDKLILQKNNFFFGAPEFRRLPIDDLRGVNHEKFLCEQKIIKIMDTPKIIDARLYMPEISVCASWVRILYDLWKYIHRRFLEYIHCVWGLSPILMQLWAIWRKKWT